MDGVVMMEIPPPPKIVKDTKFFIAKFGPEIVEGWIKNYSDVQIDLLKLKKEHEKLCTEFATNSNLMDSAEATIKRKNKRIGLLQDQNSTLKTKNAKLKLKLTLLEDPELDDMHECLGDGCTERIPWESQTCGRPDCH